MKELFLNWKVKLLLGSLLFIFIYLAQYKFWNSANLGLESQYFISRSLVASSVLIAMISLNVRVVKFLNSLDNFWFWIFIHFIFGVVFAFLQSFSTIYIFSLLFGDVWNLINLNPNRFIRIIGFELLLTGGLAVFIYWLMVLYRFFVNSVDEELKNQKKVVELNHQINLSKQKLLRGQLRPHFLFNTLSMLSETTYQNEEEANALLKKLQHYIKDSLKLSGYVLVPLRQEFESLNNYLEIERLRFQDRLDIQFVIGEGTEEQKIPAMITQPLVENSIKHSISRAIQKGKIVISALLKGRKLVIEVEDSGAPGNSVTSIKKMGFGLTNVKKRLELTYGTESKLSFDKSELGGLKSTITIPLN